MVNLAIGYVLDATGHYKFKYFFENTAKNIATFIMQNSSSNCVITDPFDQLICTSMCGFLDNVPNKEYLNKELRPTLLKFQFGEVEVVPIKFREQNYEYVQDTLLAQSI